MPAERPRRRSGGLALVYRGPAATDACAASAAVLVRRVRPDLEVRFTGHGQDLPLTARTLADAHLYVQPGGGTLRRAWRHLRSSADDVRGFVEGGGAYLGICLGAYLAGRTPGFGLFDGDTDRYAGSPGAELRHARDTVVPVSWRGSARHVFFQDGPRFLLDEPAAPGVQVLARYASGAVAALVQGRGRGRVAVVGPHPEATPDWYSHAGLVNPDGVRADLGADLLDALLTAAPGAALPGGGVRNAG
ncbi:BPL-N domain-containing protein [Kineococcus arenarius]|uniref:BPL-N domain-containing protein n=1 Tax=unclassified Kineococcus TaxID=2621656 RepID=UPI003D7F07C0